MITADMLTYEKLYFSLWETAQRYGKFVQFRVIGKSHDERLIPMLEIGTGQTCIFCISGVIGSERKMPEYLLRMVLEYCKAYESNWELEELYRVRKLLDQIRICVIPVLNPDGYEINKNGYKAIRNPIYRQMLRMNKIPLEEFTGNARGVDLRKNFPTSYYVRKKIHQEPASENETKALIRIFQEYKSGGLLSFSQSEKKIILYGSSQAFGYNQKSYRLARHLKQKSHYRLEKKIYDSGNRKQKSTGSPEQFYGEITKQPSLMIEQPFFISEDQIQEDDGQEYKDLYLLPLEYLFSLLE